jgi:hypothetical protein
MPYVVPPRSDSKRILSFSVARGELASAVAMPNATKAPQTAKKILPTTQRTHGRI